MKPTLRDQWREEFQSKIDWFGSDNFMGYVFAAFIILVAIFGWIS